MAANLPKEVPRGRRERPRFTDQFEVEASRVIEGDPGHFVGSPYVVAELDYPLAKSRGVAA